MKTATQSAIEEGEKDRKILLKYTAGRAVEDGDMATLRDFESTGIVHIGFSFGKKESQAKLTEKGKRLLGLAG